MPDERDDYEVGYGRPPKETRFKKGQSGNPKGRPKGSLSLDGLLRRELAKPITITENGKRRRVPKGEALVTRVVNTALAGDLKGLQGVLQIGKVFGIGSKEEEAQREMQELGEEAKRRLRERLLRRPSQPPLDQDPEPTKE